MDKAQQDGLFIDNSYFIKDEKKSGFRLLERAIQILAIMFGSWSTGSILIKCLNIPVNLFMVNLSVILCSGIMFLLFIIPSYDFVKLFFATLFYGLYLFSRLPALVNSFYILENLVIDRLVACYNYTGFYYEADYYTDEVDTTRLVIMILIPMIIMLTISIVRNRLVSLTSLILFLPVLISFLLGVIPKERYLIAYIACALYLARSGFSLKRTAKGDYLKLLHKINSRVAVWLSVFCLVLFFILKLCVPKEEYNSIAGLNQMKSDVQSAFLNISIEDITSKFNDYNLFERSNTSTGGLRGGELGKDGKVVYTNSEQLMIKAPLDSLSEGIYLKGYVGTEYTGDSWEGHTAADRKLYDKLLKNTFNNKFQPVNQMNQLLKQMVKNLEPYSAMDLSIPEYHIIRSRMTVKYINANKNYIYAPYFTNYNLLDEIRYEDDLYATPLERKNSYEFNYYYNLALGNSNNSLLKNLKGTNKDYVNYEKAYRNYVNQVYTKLPSKGLDRLKKDFTKKQNDLEDKSIFDKITYVKDYLNKNTSYTLSPGELPKGKDFVEYFLYDNKKGYCAHYASAATLILRMMDVPARYVEGYVAINDLTELLNDTNETQMGTIYSPDGRETSSLQNINFKLTDRSAHAWVEVYIDGCGWIPVDFTPGSSIENNGDLVHDLSGASTYFNSENSKDNITPTNVPTKAAPTVTKAPIDKEKNKPKQDKSSDSSTISKENTIRDTLFIITLFLFVLAAGLFVVIKIRKHRRFTGLSNYNKRALLIFAQTEKLLSLSNFLPDRKTDLDDSEEYVKRHCPYIKKKKFESFMEIVKKARFGNKSISDDELNEIKYFHKDLSEALSKDLSLRKRLQIKILTWVSTPNPKEV